MDLNVHKAILYYAMQTSGSTAKVDSDFLPIWAGNWMSDINQASAVLGILPDSAVKSFFRSTADFNNYMAWKNTAQSAYKAYKAPPSVEYNLNPLLRSIEENWTNLINELWNAEVKSTNADSQLQKASTAKVVLFDLQKIGMYYPLDHFDVVESEDITEIKGIVNKFTKTARDGIYDHACGRLLNNAFVLRDAGSADALFYLGRALHVLADFFAHSNYVYLLLRHFAETNKEFESIDSYFSAGWEALLFKKYATLSEIPVMTGRFDKIDTIASILKIYRKHLIPDFNDFKEEIISIDRYKSIGERLALINSKVEQSDTLLALNLLFGTFSNFTIVKQFEGAVFLAAKVLDFLKRFTGEIKNEILNVIDKIIEQELSSTDSEHLVDFAKELKTYDPDDAKSELKNHLRAAKVTYYEYMVQKTLIDNLFEHASEYLPHHTLIANDTDSIHPVRRLEYKLACYLAHSVSAEILKVYYDKGLDAQNAMVRVNEIIGMYYQNPEEYFKSNTDTVENAINAMYGERWWEYVSKT